MTGPVKNITFGGVQFNQNDIKEKKELKGTNGEKMYSVFLKNGVKIKYPEQPKTIDLKFAHYSDNSKREITNEQYEKYKEENCVVSEETKEIKPKVTTYENGVLMKDYQTDIRQLQNGEIIGSDNVDIINLADSRNSLVNVADDDNFRGDRVNIQGGKNNEVNLGNGDDAKIGLDLRKAKEIDGPGVLAQKDYE